MIQDHPRMVALDRLARAHSTLSDLVEGDEIGHDTVAMSEHPYCVVALALVSEGVMTENRKVVELADDVIRACVRHDGTSDVLNAIARLSEAAGYWLRWESDLRQFGSAMTNAEVRVRELVPAPTVDHADVFNDNEMRVGADKVFTPESSNVEWYAHAGAVRCLYVKFQSSDVVYRYAGVASSVVADLAAASSKGRFVGTTFVRTKYPFAKLDLDGAVIR